MCGIVGYIGPRDATPIILNGLKKAGVPRLRLGRPGCRSRRQRWRSARTPASCRSWSTWSSARPIAGRAGHRAHPLGNPRRAVCPQRAPASRADRARGRRPQRHRRELPGTEGRTDRGGREVQLGYRHRNHRAPGGTLPGGRLRFRGGRPAHASADRRAPTWWC